MTRRLRGWFLLPCLLASVSFVELVSAQDAARGAAIVLRVLSYDRNVAQRASGQVTVLVVFRSGNGASETEQRQFTAALNALGRQTTVANMNARAVEVPYANKAGLLASIRQHRAAAIYVCDGLNDAVNDIRDAANEARVLSITRNADAVRRGLGVGLVNEGAQIRLLVNLGAAQAQGARLDATLLRLAQVIR